jgi:hypothetical protein
LLENGAGVSGSYTNIAPGYKGTTAINGDLTIRSVLRPAPQNPGTIWFGNTIAPLNDQIFNIGTSAERFGNGYFFNTEGWGIMEKILAFLENRLPRSCPYSALQYIRHEDFYKAEIREGIVYGDVQIFEGIVKQIDLDEAETEYYESENESDENDTDQEFMDEDLPDEPPVLTRQNAFILG